MSEFGGIQAGANTNSNSTNNANNGDNDNYFGDLNDELSFGGPDDDPEDNNFLDMYNLTPRQRVVYKAKKLIYQAKNRFDSLKVWQRGLVYLAAICFLIAGGLFLVYRHKIMDKIVDTSNDLEAKKSTQFLLLLFIFIVAFPPLIGYSFLSTSTGLIYGVSFHGWIILALGSVCGSVASFTVFKNLLHSRAEKLIHANRRFEAFASILQENNSYLILALFRLCPFPYSLTNGAVAGVYGISVRNFAIANVITTPKLLVYLFIGSRIKNLAETESPGSKLFDIISIFVAVCILMMTAWILYYKTNQKYKQLQREDNQAPIDSLGEADFEI
ncbi:similar to Saccharomyces cerevisiae YKR088C TVP38 Integral membrane protein localized to late Golgi vesicles along with the v-SNARE Tlg2p [Maudiozyma barnettii]|uniref:Golgi apparatus membrane protein TVP38 n=1 Tax=Maudiozyma barnettii TaxID=61262 RepID=A0A8H2ZLD9_9SACH|nr:Tvp38p [Kazachstania barnettii]CAB4256042.1 similar to Saccharomyces cerevisiae YKR088C TVP38 Integral membrane protein localized to late Golgi vesicles along with the v-SNARE Tlg2p [Kazachstania barnettii]CAD1784650.1 similar to Saccharomyces cerevisiae YKR088C TVP38 Integral membrane protein localized to late Golgi vesicles along with the v-SNARE Tlg2p [Kazachstania barnettii]